MITTKKELFQTICNAARLGTLGFFVGAGFSKALLLNNSKFIAYRWGELLEHCCEKLDVNKSIMEDYCSYPDLASKICKAYAENSDITYGEAVKKFKHIVCELTNTYPELTQRENYEKWFKTISPAWIATTNYDTLIESVLGGTALSIAPNGYFCNINGMTPVFHIHGICSEPDGIIITSEDYTYMFRPNDYRQARLPFLMKESCVLMIGYGLGDINVITAVDWANNVYTNVNDGYDFPIIQLLYSENPKPDPYINQDNVILYEIGNLDIFFAELSEFMKKYNEEYIKKEKLVLDHISYMVEADEETIKKFIDNEENIRTSFFSFFSELEPEFGYAYNPFFLFVRRVMLELDKMARPSGAFVAYDIKLRIILDIFCKIPFKKIPASFRGMLAEELNSVAGYIDPAGRHISGNSYSATDSWIKYKNKIPEQVVNELRSLVTSSTWGYYQLKSLLRSIEDRNE